EMWARAGRPAPPPPGRRGTPSAEEDEYTLRRGLAVQLSDRTRICSARRIRYGMDAAVHISGGANEGFDRTSSTGKRRDGLHPLVGSRRAGVGALRHLPDARLHV